MVESPVRAFQTAPTDYDKHHCSGGVCNGLLGVDTIMTLFRWVGLCLLWLLPQGVQATEFVLTFDKKALDQPFTGRVFVVLLRFESENVIGGLNWFNPEPTFAKDVKNWKPETPFTMDESALAITPWANLKPVRYYAQAILDRDLGGISFSASPGNLYSKPVAIDVDPKKPAKVDLRLDQVVQERPFKETPNVRLMQLESKLLSKFHDAPITMQAGVIVPLSFLMNPEKKYPIVYEIPGFSGDHRMAFGLARRNPCDVAGTEVIWVVLNPNCRLGHHVFADSANNGPWGKALTEEFIPALEKQFRGNGKRLVTGHSSGGWSSLWLQITYPEVFHGCWSTSPDSVDFRDFQRVDIYSQGANLFVDSTQTRRPLGRRNGKPVLYYKPFSDMEFVMGRGGQLGSFEAVFSPRGTDGQPVRLWDRKSGAIRTDVAKEWEKYDIRLVLERNWATLEPKLKGKVHVYMGDVDTFYLDGATRLLKESLATLGSDAVVEMFPGKDHGLVDQKLLERMKQEMAKALK